MVDEKAVPVSVIMPVRNERDHIERSMTAMLTQDYAGQIEVICVDGQSDDGTREILDQIAARDLRVRVFDNPGRIVPTAMNIGLREARYPLIARMDGHTLPPADYLRQCINVLQSSGADCVGGGWVYVGDGVVSSAIAAAMESPFGAGTAAWRGGGEIREVDTVPFGVWRRERMLALGGFDERLVVNQDYEFLYRLRKSGGRVVYVPNIKTVYYPRGSLGGLWRQYLKYGIWKARVLQLHPASFRLRHMVAPAFVAGLIGGALSSILLSVVLPVYTAIITLYFVLSIWFSLLQAARHGWRALPLIPMAFWNLHLAWGIGFWIGMWPGWILRQRNYVHKT
jgi:cellulose synthase/poly-beta-1,6-N-acetylglucosamine synthase-like glycosyltransferase